MFTSLLMFYRPASQRLPLLLSSGPSESQREAPPWGASAGSPRPAC